jgi:hypothetical protein
MPASLTSNSISGTYLQLLHIGDGTPGVARVKSGNGTDTSLEFVSGGTKVNGTLQATGNATLSGTLAVTGAATFSGAVAGLGIPVFRHVTADVTAATTTEVAIAAFDFVPVSGAVYAVEMNLIARTLATTTGVQITNSGGAGTLLLVMDGSAFEMTIGSTLANTSSPSASVAFGIRLFGVFTASSTAALAFSLKSEVAASAVTVKAGSILKITRIS